MRMIFEQDVEDEDFIEIMLTTKQYSNIADKGVSKQFINPFTGRILNVFLRIDDSELDDYEKIDISGEK